MSWEWLTSSFSLLQMHSLPPLNLYYVLAAWTRIAYSSLIFFTVFPFSPVCLHAVFSAICWGGADYKYKETVQCALPAGCTSESGLRGRSLPTTILTRSTMQLVSMYDISFSSTFYPLRVLFKYAVQHLGFFCTSIYEGKVDWSCMLF